MSSRKVAVEARSPCAFENLYSTGGRGGGNYFSSPARRLTLTLVHRRGPVSAAVLLLAQHGVKLFRLVRVQRQQLVDHLSDGRVFPDPRVRVHDDGYNGYNNKIYGGGHSSCVYLHGTRRGLTSAAGKLSDDDRE